MYEGTTEDKMWQASVNSYAYGLVELPGMPFRWFKRNLRKCIINKDVKPFVLIVIIYNIYFCSKSNLLI